MNITLRKKKLKDSRISLYLDYYLPEAEKPRRKESLNLYLKEKPRTPSEREHNKQTLKLAENICSTRLLDLQHEHYDFEHLIGKESKKSIDLIHYFEKVVIAQRHKSEPVKSMWNSAFHHVKIFCKHKPVLLKAINKDWIEEYKFFLLNEAMCKRFPDKPVAQNSAQHFFAKLKYCLDQAAKERLMPYNPFTDVKGISKEEVIKEFLTLEELKRGVNTPCDSDLYKRAFLFGCFTGMRWSDIKQLKWENIAYSEMHGYNVRYQQKKTKGLENLPINKQAIALLDDKNKQGLVFKNLTYNNRKMKNVFEKWMKDSNISKAITFHCSRHTFATLQLTLGTDIYTVSKLLGHKDVSVTQIYAKIINKVKVDAVNRIPEMVI